MKDRGIVGIDVLILFITMILVATIVAGVLIRITGVLQEQAQTTAREAIRQVSTGVTVVSIIGRVSPDYENIDNMQIVVKLYAGSEPIDLTKMTIQYISDTAEEHLIIGKYDEYLMAFETRQELELRWGQLDANEFAVVKIQNISRTPPHILGVGDVVEIWVNVKEIEEPHALKAQRIATLILTPKIGFETHVRAIVPEILWTKKVVSLYW